MANTYGLAITDTPVGVPSVYSVASYTKALGSSGQRIEGHTGIIIAIKGDYIVYMDTHNGLTGMTYNSRVRIDKIPAAGSGVTYVYLGDYLKEK